MLNEKIRNGEVNNTGEILDEIYILKEVDFDKYTVTVKLSNDRKFLGIEQIAVNKSFFDFEDIIKQKISLRIEYPIIEEEG